jgi:carboxymethylenebutenolidase
MPDITIQGPDGGFGAYLAIPASTPAPGIVVAQEIFGVNQVMREVCDWLAAEGFLACCPDIFWRIEPGIQLTDKTEASPICAATRPATARSARSATAWAASSPT